MSSSQSRTHSRHLTGRFTRNSLPFYLARTTIFHSQVKEERSRRVAKSEYMVEMDALKTKIQKLQGEIFHDQVQFTLLHSLHSTTSWRLTAA